MGYQSFLCQVHVKIATDDEFVCSGKRNLGKIAHVAFRWLWFSATMAVKSDKCPIIPPSGQKIMAAKYRPVRRDSL
jgi:hypothetical protein